MVRFHSQTEMYGGQLDEKTKSCVEGLIASFDKLPTDSKDIMKNVLDPMLTEMDKKNLFFLPKLAASRMAF